MARRRGWGGSPPADDDEASQRIVAAAVDLIDRTGAEISIADVAQSLGVIRQTVYRYFPSADALMRAAAIASVEGFLERLTRQVAGLDDPVEAMTEGVVYTLAEVRRTPHLGILLSSTYSNPHPEALASEEAWMFGMAMITRFDVDWKSYGYDDDSLAELVEYVLRTMQSFFVSPGTPPRSDDDLRRYLRRWMGTAILAQREWGPKDPTPGGREERPLSRRVRFVTNEEQIRRADRTRDGDPQNVPRPVDGEADRMVVETTWGEVQPLQVATGVTTVGELEVIELLGRGAVLVDTRVPDSRSGVTLPGAVNMPHDDIVARKGELDTARTTIVFCNGPQCPQSPDAIRKLIEAGYPASALAYYRGGLHDWATLGYPLAPV